MSKKEQEKEQENGDEGDNGDDDGGTPAVQGVDIHARTRGRRTRPARAHTS